MQITLKKGKTTTTSNSILVYLAVLLYYNGKLKKLTQVNIAEKDRKCLSMLYGKMKNMCLNVESE